MTDIAVVNHSRSVANIAVSDLVPILQEQVTQFCPVWNIPVPLLHYIPGTMPPPIGWWVLAILDDADQAGALGYHQDALNGMPLGKVFARLSIQAGLRWSVTASHELLEMLADPFLNQTIYYGGKQYSQEVCDPCEDDRYAYQISGIWVSDFITPHWYTGRGDPPYDFQGHIKRPRQLLRGGYCSYQDRQGQWHQPVYHATAHITARPGSSGRTARRIAA